MNLRGSCPIGDPVFSTKKLPLYLSYYLYILIFCAGVVAPVVAGVVAVPVAPRRAILLVVIVLYTSNIIAPLNTLNIRYFTHNQRIKHRCTLFVDKILYRRMHEDKMRGGLPALIRPRIV